MLTIVIPFYKIDFFEETLASLANQTNKDFNVYIGNDASPDDPEELINLYKGKMNIRYKKFKKNVGQKSLVKHWDRCVAMTQDEEWLMILGDDDYLEADVVEKWYNQINSFSSKTNVIRLATISVDENSKPISKIFKHPIWESAADSYFRRFLQHTRSSLSEYIFRKQCYKKYGFYDFPLAWFTDNRAWLEFAENKPIYTINDAVVFIRTSELNISGRTDNLELKSEALIQFFDYLIRDKLKLFKKEQRLKLLRYYEDRLKEVRKWSLSKKAHFTYYHFKNYDSHIFIKFTKRQIKSFLNRDN